MDNIRGLFLKLNIFLVINLITFYLTSYIGVRFFVSKYSEYHNEYTQ